MSQIADLELSIHRQDQQSYAVDFRYTDSDPDNQADVRLGAKQQALVAVDFSTLHEIALTGDFLAYGKVLTASLFADESLRTAFAQARVAAEHARASLRIRLAIGPNAQELYSLRWETLLDPQSGLSLATDHTIYFSRYLSSLDWRPVRLHARGELHALAAIAAPSGLEKYKLASVDRKKELATIKNGLGEISLQVLKCGRLNDIIAALTATPVDILYLVAHGTVANNEPVLWLEDEDNQIQRMPGNELIARLRELESRPRLVVLASCQSAGKGQGDALAALGPRLAEVGVPAVLAMQGNISMETISKFIPVFFQELQKDGRIDRALNVARGQVRDQPDWWMPVLFMRLKSGRLWYTPGFSEQSGSGDFETEVRYINRERCTPIIGPGLIESLLGPTGDVARQWAETFHYPMSPFDRDALPKVAQYLSIDKGEAVPFDEYEETIQRTLKASFRDELPVEMANMKWVELDALAKVIGAKRRAENPLDAFRILAKLPFPLYIVATPDRLLEDALEEVGRKPEVIISPWNARLAQRKTVFDLRPDYEPSAENPLVFYLFGRWNDRGSLVLTEDEYIKYLIGFTSNRAFVPEQVRLALSDSLLLFLGFQPDDWAFRVIFHSILAQAGSELLGQYAHIAAQIEPEDERTLDPLRARRYLEKYFIKGANINLFWGRAEEYLTGLMQKWQGQNR